MSATRYPARRFGRQAGRLLVVLGAAVLLQACGGGDGESAEGQDTGLLPTQTPGVPIPGGQIDMAVSRLDGLAQELMQRSNIPGMAVAVVHDGKTVYAKGFGVRRVGAPERIDADTVFQLASMSKPVGATVVASQIGKRLLGTTGPVDLAWDTPVERLLPVAMFRLQDDWVSQQVTVGDLYAHRSGLSDHAGDDLETLGYGRADIMQRLRYTAIPDFAGRFRNEYAYTNFGLTVAAEAVAEGAGQSWEALSRQAVYDPLGMSSTSSTFADYIIRPDRAWPHVADGQRGADGRYAFKALGPDQQRDPDPQSPAGGVSSSANDMAKWMAMVLQNGQIAGRQVVAADALLPAITAQIVSAPSSSPDSRPGYYGYGFNVGVESSGRTLISHSGAFLAGAATCFSLLPSANVGIVVLTNALPLGVAETLAAEFMSLVQYGDITQPWWDLYSNVFAAMLAPSGELAGKTPPASPAPPSAGAAAYLGSYGNDYLGDVAVSGTPDNLVLTMSAPAGKAPLTYPLRHWDADTYVFDLSGEDGSPGSVSQAVFSVSGGVARSLYLEFYDSEGMGTLARR